MADHLRTRVVVSGDVVEVYEYPIGISVGHKLEYKIERKGEDESDGKRLDNLYRARKTIRRLVWCNVTKQFTKMITLSYAETQLDIKKVKIDIQHFVQQMRRYGYDMKYVYVLEHQKERGKKEGNEGSLHVHMFLFNDLKVKLEHLNKSWKLGGTHIGVLRDIKDSGAYCCKYITKETVAKYGQHCYGCSRGLKRPTEEHLYEEGYSDTLVDGVTTRHILDGLNVTYISEIRHDYLDDKGEGHVLKVKYSQGKWKGDNRLVTLSENVRIDFDEEDAFRNARAILDSLGE